ncbi:MAG: alanine--tRNA ligase [Planctomycetota bacterium]
MKSSEVRERYLSFFEKQGHTRMASDSLVPESDPTLLFTGAGMNQFKEMFLGKGNLPWKRVTTSQKCLRVPDLDNVGRTPRHHTFFEMLGNFSFGDYFKKECIRWEWDYFTQALGFDRNHLWVTIYLDDDEAYNIWKNDIGIPAERIYRFGEKENFWPAEAPSKGPNGPCGPCSEIYYDNQPGGAPPATKNSDGSPLESMPDKRFLEVGNCVFTQFDRRDGGVLQALPQKNIDVGLGLERIVAVLQGASNNFETDLFLPYIHDLERRSGKRYETNTPTGIRMRRIADHLRAVTFCITDSARPSNEGRGYVVRKILRRACRDLYELGLDMPTLHEMVPLVGTVMGAAYPELLQNTAMVQSLMKGEEERFREVYVRGFDRLEELFDKSKATKIVSGADAFLLHDTLGFPVDLIEQIAVERGFSVDMPGFERAMEEQQNRSRAGSGIANEIFVEGPETKLRLAGVEKTDFTGYADDNSAYISNERFVVSDAKIVGIVDPCYSDRILNEIRIDTQIAGAEQGQLSYVEEKRGRIGAQSHFLIILDRTPFYAESGGQVGDIGIISGNTYTLNVLDVTKRGDFVFHECRVQVGNINIRKGDIVRAEVDRNSRLSTERHHTATHLLHLALRSVLGPHVNQAGSLVAPDRLRFDFTHGGKVTNEQIQQIEDFVNSRVLQALPVSKKEMSLTDAKNSGAMMLFGEKYGEKVRVLGAADSVELCGGTHVGNTGNIGLFKIISEASTAAGIRRIEAVCGPLAFDLMREREKWLTDISNELKSPPAAVVERIKQLRAELKQAKEAKAKATSMDKKDAEARLRESLVKIKDGVAAVAVLPGFPAEDMKALVDSIRKDAPDHAIVILCPNNTPGAESVAFVVALAGAPSKRMKAGDVAKLLGPKLGGGGGGRPDFAQGQGKNVVGVDEAAAIAKAALGIV